MKRWQGASPALTPEQTAELMQLKPAMAHVRSVWQRIDELALSWGVPSATLRRYLWGGLPKRYGGHGRD